MAPKPLNPCPFCGKRDLEVQHLGSAERRFFVVACEGCEAEGPIARSAIKASEAWNTRAAPKSDGE